ncbi:serine/threonine-protein kinase HT1 [Gossypium australe]|uniref:non-specific serine/threonine protein kinase n=1 Tax=Gossypium australe TaxID=47621 RepID=A0A5B6UEG4_9ROSI|nr:serine/threonine-protein kinase HT1 [Gossypium australe]
MDLKTGEEDNGIKAPKRQDGLEGGGNSKMKGNGSISGKDMIFRADQIDLKSLDMQLEKHLSRVWSRNIEKQRPAEEWEIDLAKLDLRNVIAHGTYGTVYRATYDNQDVAGADSFSLTGLLAFAELKNSMVEDMTSVTSRIGVVRIKLLDWGEDGIATTAETAALRASFRQEVAVWHKLDHPNVTKFIGASMGTSNLKIPSKNPSADNHNPLPSRACCVVVEYLPGGTLKQYLIRNRRKKLAFKIVVQIALDLARGLSYLHSRKIVHRDVKTENMLLDGHRNIKIADFGVARVEAQNPRDMTGETGTLGYMAPEVLEGKPYNRTCDVYSFGICLWEIYCCDMPYPDLSFADVSSAVVRQNLRPDIPRCCPNSLANIMKKCWDANPEKRPAMEEVVRMLEAVNTNKGGGMIPDDHTPTCLCLVSPRGP